MHHTQIYPITRCVNLKKKKRQWIRDATQNVLFKRDSDYAW